MQFIIYLKLKKCDVMTVDMSTKCCTCIWCGRDANEFKQVSWPWNVTYLLQHQWDLGATSIVIHRDCNFSITKQADSCKHVRNKNRRITYFNSQPFVVS